MGNITTLDRLKDHMWEEDREFFREHNMYHLLRLMFRLNACVDFKLKQVSVSVGTDSRIFHGEDIVVAMAKAMKYVDEVERNA